jgi:hypothetical protein
MGWPVTDRESLEGSGHVTQADSWLSSFPSIVSPRGPSMCVCVCVCVWCMYVMLVERSSSES